MTRKEPNLNLFLIKAVLNLLLIIHLKSARIIMLYRHTCKRPLGLFVYIFTKIYSKPSKRGFFCWGDKKNIGNSQQLISWYLNSKTMCPKITPQGYSNWSAIIGDSYLASW